MRKTLKSVAVAIGLAASSFAPALAEYPEQPVQFIVPWPPGDLEDVLTRLIADEMQAETGVAATYEQLFRIVYAEGMTLTTPEHREAHVQEWHA